MGNHLLGAQGIEIAWQAVADTRGVGHHPAGVNLMYNRLA